MFLLKGVKLLVKPYKIFIIHAWKESRDKYHDLVSMLESTNEFRFINNSSPKKRNLFFGYKKPETKIKNFLKKRIRDSQVILLICSKGFSSRKWIRYEIAVANYYRKPIIYINPFCIEEEFTIKSKYYVKAIWSSDNVVNLIKENASEMLSIGQTVKIKDGILKEWYPTYNGKMFCMRRLIYDILGIKGEKVVIGANGVVMATVIASILEKI